MAELLLKSADCERTEQEVTNMEYEEGPADDEHRLTLLVRHRLLVLFAAKDKHATSAHASRNQDVEDIHLEPEAFPADGECDILWRQAMGNVTLTIDLLILFKGCINQWL